MKGIIIRKNMLFSVLLTESNDFILIKNIPNTTVGSGAFVLDIETVIIPKPFYKLFCWFSKMKNNIHSLLSLTCILYTSLIVVLQI